MKTLLFSHLLILLLTIIFIFKTFDIRNAKGKYIMKLKNRKGLLIFLIASFVFFIHLLFLNLKTYIIFNRHKDFMDIILSLIWIFISLLHISKTFKYSEIREKGIYLENGFYSWNKIYYYEWMSPDTIKFKVQGSNLNEYEEKVKVSCKNKKQIDKILQKYIKLSSSII